MRVLLALLICISSLVPVLAGAAEGGIKLRHMSVDLSDRASLQRGARVFTNYCLSCHAARQVRYKQVLPGLGITAKEMRDNLMLPGRKIGDKMTVAMTHTEGKQWFGVAPPDLSNIERVRGADWLYTYLTSFYLDPSRPTGVNNALFPKVAMPDVLWELQGLQKPVYKTVKDADGKTRKVLNGFKVATKGRMSAEQSDRMVRDLVNFLAYMSAPYQQKSHLVGAWIILGLILFTISAYFLKREYWKDVDH